MLPEIQGAIRIHQVRSKNIVKNLNNTEKAEYNKASLPVDDFDPKKNM